MNHKLIAHHRLDDQHDGSMVLVLALTTDVEAELFSLKPHAGRGHRVVLDLMQATSPAALGDRPKDAPDTQAGNQSAGISAGGDREGGSEAVTLQDLRLGQWPDRTRLVLETDRELTFRLMTPGPGKHIRLEFDGLAADILSTALHSKLPYSRKLIHHADISDARSAQGARLELRLGRHTAVNTFKLKPDGENGHRFVLDLLPQPDLEQSQPPPRELKADPAPQADRVLAGTETEMLWLEARLNQQGGAQVVLALRGAGGQLLLGGKDLRQWRLRLPESPDRHEHDEDWYALESLGIEYELDSGRLTLELTAPVALFVGYALDRPQPAYIQPTPAGLGAFLNYDLSVTRSSSTTGGGVLELGAFSGKGSGTTTAVVRHGSADIQSPVVRLDSSWRRDDPERLRSLIVGDTTTTATAWSGSVRFGGVRYGRNFSTQPEFITLPMLSMAGEAALPSTIELYVNEALRLRREVEPGQFLVDEIPAVTGAGEVRLVVRDVLGREQVISRSYFASPRLLQRGLHDWSWNAGFIREDYGLDSFDYGRFLASTTHRYGVSDRLTVEGHVQWLESQGMAGVGAAWLLPGRGVVHAAAAYSQSEHGSGQLYIVGVQHQGERFSAGLESQFADSGFSRLGMNVERHLPLRQYRAHVSTRLPGGSSLSLSFTRQDLLERDDVEFFTLRFSRRLGDFGFFNLTALHRPDDQETTLSAALSIPLSHARTSAGISGSWREERQQSSVHVQRSLPSGTGYGYRVQLGQGDNARHQASLDWRHAHGTWQLETGRSGGQVATRATVGGGFAVMAGNMFATRRIRDSFAVVEVPGFENVRIYADNQQVAHTNSSGIALVPRLRAYERNRLRIDQADLPLGTRIDGLEETVAPYWRSGVFVSFPVARARDAFFRILLEDGQPLPVGAAVEDERGELWPVGHRGEVFLTDLLPSNLLRAHYNGQRCEFVLVVPDNDSDPLPDLGTVRCIEVKS